MLNEQAKGRIRRRPTQDQRMLEASLQASKRELGIAQKLQAAEDAKTVKKKINADQVVRALLKEGDLLASVKQALHLIPVALPWKQFGPRVDLETDLYIRKDVTGREVLSVWKSKAPQRDIDGKLEEIVRWQWQLSLPKWNEERGFVFFTKDGDEEFLDTAMTQADQMLVAIVPDTVFLDPEDGIGVRMERFMRSDVEVGDSWHDG